MGINGNFIKHFELTKTFRKEVLKFTKNDDDLAIKIKLCVKDFTINKFESIYYRKPLKNGEFKNFDIHELQIGWDFRIIIQIKISLNKDGTYTCYFINFWSHSSLNLVWNKKLKINPVN